MFKKITCAIFGKSGLKIAQVFFKNITKLIMNTYNTHLDSLIINRVNSSLGFR